MVGGIVDKMPKTKGDHRSPGVAFAEIHFVSQRAASGSPRFEDGVWSTPSTRRPPRRGASSREEERRVRASPEPVSESLVSTPAVRAAQRRSKRGMAVSPSPASVPSHSTIQHAAVERLPGSRPPREETSRRRRRALHSSSAPWMPTPARRSPERGGRLEEPPNPIRPLSVRQCHEGTDVRAAFRRCARQLVSARQSVRRFTFETRARGDVAGLERRSPCSDTLPSCRNLRARGR